jgi:hypothetical protein
MEIVDSKALIPNYLLQTGKQLCVYAVKDGVTIERKTFSVKKRERPENYVYDEDNRNYIYELITDAQEAIDAANQAAQDLLAAKERGDFNGPKGEKGDTGEKGDEGPAGYSPVRGIDYWTEGDQDVIKSYVDDAILGGSW